MLSTHDNLGQSAMPKFLQTADAIGGTPSSEAPALHGCVALFEPAVSGHRIEFLEHLCNYWIDKRPFPALALIVGHDFRTRYEDSFGPIERLTSAGIRIFCVADSEEEALRSGGQIRSSFFALQLARRYTIAANADLCVGMDFDSLLPALLTSPRLPFKLAGLYFRPPFNYRDLRARSFRTDIIRWLQAKVVSRILRRPDVGPVFTLDDGPIRDCRLSNGISGLKYAPDPVELKLPTTAELSQLRQTLKIDGYRKVALLFGSIESRKGLASILNAVRLLSAESASQLLLLIAGRFVRNRQTTTPSEVRRICQSKSVEVRVVDEFVPRTEIPAYFAISDFVLTLYPLHIGSSGVLLRACAARKPVLASDFGWIGRIVAEYGLGITVSAQDPAAISDGLARMLRCCQNHFDIDRGQDLVNSHTPAAFSESLWRGIHCSS